MRPLLPASPQGLAMSILAALAVALLAASCSRAPRADAIPAGSIVVALGDSLTYGTGAAPDASYPDVLARLSGWRIVNAGVPGETAAQGCERLPSLLEEHEPKLVLVLLGGNDQLRHLPEQSIAEALAACIDAARGAKVPLVLMPVPRLRLSGLSDAPLYRDLAQAEHVPLVDAGLAELLGQRSLRSDAVHLNDQGYRAMAGRIAAGLRDVGYLAR